MKTTRTQNLMAAALIGAPRRGTDTDGPDEVHRNAIAKLELSKHVAAPKR